MTIYSRNCELKPGIEFPDHMQRMCIGIEYNGTAFHGFQVQKFAVDTVQGALHEALSWVADESITLVCAGRTDAGVHASSQVAHFDTLADRPLKAWSMGVNARLPAGVSIKWAMPVVPAFHARFSATARTYRYVIYNNPSRPAVLSKLVTWFKRPLNHDSMQSAAACLLGEHDFSAFRASQCQANSPVRRVESLRFAAFRDFVVIEIKANAFLHHMVRNIVGSLLAIAAGDKPVSWMKELLEGRDRRLAAATAPGDGLYLVAVDYPAEFGIPDTPPGPDLVPEQLDWQIVGDK
ncbi:tRNA pseudouridine(38-40) synthase TruA [Aurantivibrio plasticivorans]